MSDGGNGFGPKGGVTWLGGGGRRGGRCALTMPDVNAQPLDLCQLPRYGLKMDVSAAD